MQVRLFKAFLTKAFASMLKVVKKMETENKMKGEEKTIVPTNNVYNTVSL